MITIISGTARPNSNTRKVANAYAKLLTNLGHANQVLCLQQTSMLQRDEQFVATEKTHLADVQKIIIVMPEYNGTFPGILKLMIDNTNVSKVWPQKKILLTGVSTGRAGNIRGMEHLTGSLMHMQSVVHPNRLPISGVQNLLNANGELDNEAMLAVMPPPNAAASSPASSTSR